MKKILITTSNFDLNHNPAISSLKEIGYEIVSNPYKRRLCETEVQELLLDNQIIGMIAGVEPLTRSVLQQAKNLRVISRCGIGLDNVALDTASELNIRVLNTPDAPVKAVAELTLGLILSALRHIPLADSQIKQQQWKPLMGALLHSKIVGLVGFGRVGQTVAKLVSAFGANVIYYDPFTPASPETGIKQASSLEHIAQTADILSLHLPYSADTHHIIDQSVLSQMKPEAILINASRGGLIDESSLLAHLSSHTSMVAALDVFEQEPYTGPLLNLANVIATAHMGGYAKECRSIMENQAASNLVEALSLVNKEASS